MKQVSKNLGIIKQEGERLTNLINGLLDLAKIESGKTEWNIREVNPVEIVERATSATATLFEQKPSLQLITDIPDNFPTIKADRDRLIQVLINLISNAVKFTENGHVKISVSAEFQTENTEQKTLNSPQILSLSPSKGGMGKQIVFKVEDQ